MPRPHLSPRLLNLSGDAINWGQMGTNRDKWGQIGTNKDKWGQIGTNGDKYII